MIAPVMNWYFRQRYEELQQQSLQAPEMQSELLENLMENAARTAYGNTYGARGIKNYHQFRNQFPVTRYEDLKPWIERTMEGEQQLLWPGEITWFAKSSGTTGNTSKFIPISYESLEETHFKGGRDTLTFFCAQNPDTKIFQGKGLLIGGSHKINQHNSRSYYGDLSAVLMNHLPAWANFKSTPDMSIALMENWEEKVERMAEATLKENVTSISGVPTWTLVLFNRLLEMTGKSDIRDIWPNLEVFIHGGVSFVPYREQFQQYISGNMRYQETYNASEGFFGIQANANEAAMLLMTMHGIFYEFYPVDKGPDHCIPLWETVTGVNYAMVITTNSGLWRYEIGDTIRFSSVHPYLFTISGRTKLFINAFGEELVIENADTAIAAACVKTGAVVNDYTAAPIYMTDKDPGHEWLIEFEKQPANLTEFTQCLDEELKISNGDYAAKRHCNLAMHMPHVQSVPKGFFRQWLKSKGKLGGQHKVPRLCNDRVIMDELLSMLQGGRAEAESEF